MHKKDSADVSDLTAIIKTFERPYAVKRLVKSIRRRYPDLQIIVVDDSEKPAPVDDTNTLFMPYDSGLPAGRNLALDNTQTPFFLLLDDDFIFTHRQNLGDLLRFMRTHTDVDILGGVYLDMPLYNRIDYHNTPINAKSKSAKTPLGTLYEGHPVVDIVQNYFIGRTKAVKAVKWNTDYKLNDHREFFSRAKGTLTSVFHSEMKILHAKRPFDKAYLAKRYRNLRPEILKRYTQENV